MKARESSANTEPGSCKAAELNQAHLNLTATATFQFVQPHRWMEEVNCLIGPFSSWAVANYFADSVLPYAHVKVDAEAVFELTSDWFIAVYLGD